MLSKTYKILLLIAVFMTSVNAYAEVTYIHTDMMGSPIAESDEQGNITKRFHYKPYGETLEPATNNEPGYTGQTHDADLELTYMRARYYDPSIGRFYSNDPVGYVGHLNRGNPVHGFNRYAYANNNPYKYNDPDGEFAHIVIGAAVGAVIGGISYAATTDNFSWGGFAGNMATGAVVGGVTAAVPGAIAAGTLNFGGRAANALVSVGNATAAGATGNVANQAMAGGDIDTGQALVAGAANALGMVGGQAVQPLAKAAATTTVAAKAGLPVQSLSGKTFQVGAAPAKTVTNEGAQQVMQDTAGEAASALINKKLNE